VRKVHPLVQIIHHPTAASGQAFPSLAIRLYLEAAFTLPCSALREKQRQPIAKYHKKSSQLSLCAVARPG
jgi:hypothetical protein